MFKLFLILFIITQLNSRGLNTDCNNNVATFERSYNVKTKDVNLLLQQLSPMLSNMNSYYVNYKNDKTKLLTLFNIDCGSILTPSMKEYLIRYENYKNIITKFDPGFITILNEILLTYFIKKIKYFNYGEEKIVQFIYDIHNNMELESYDDFKEAHKDFNIEILHKYYNFFKQQGIINILVKKYYKTLIYKTEIITILRINLIAKLEKLIEKFVKDKNPIETKYNNELDQYRKDPTYIKLHVLFVNEFVFELSEILIIKRSLIKKDIDNKNNLLETSVINYNISKFLFKNPYITKSIFSQVNESIKHVHFFEELEEDDYSAINEELEKLILSIFLNHFNIEVNNYNPENHDIICPKLDTVEAHGKMKVEIFKIFELYITSKLIEEHFYIKEKVAKNIHDSYAALKKEVNQPELNKYRCSIYFGMYVKVFRQCLSVIEEFTDTSGNKIFTQIKEKNNEALTYSKMILTKNFVVEPNEYVEINKIYIEKYSKAQKSGVLNSKVFKDILKSIVHNVRYLYSEDFVVNNIILFGLNNYLLSNQEPINPDLFLSNLFIYLRSDRIAKYITICNEVINKKRSIIAKDLKQEVFVILKNDPLFKDVNNLEMFEYELVNFTSLLFYMIKNFNTISDTIFEIYHKFDYLRFENADFLKNQSKKYIEKMIKDNYFDEVIIEKYDVKYLNYKLFDQFLYPYLKLYFYFNIGDYINNYLIKDNKFCNNLENKSFNINIQFNISPVIINDYYTSFNDSNNIIQLNSINNILNTIVYDNILVMIFKYGNRYNIKTCNSKALSLAETDEEEDIFANFRTSSMKMDYKTLFGFGESKSIYKVEEQKEVSVTEEIITTTEIQEKFSQLTSSNSHIEIPEEIDLMSDNSSSIANKNGSNIINNGNQINTSIMNNPVTTNSRSSSVNGSGNRSSSVNASIMSQKNTTSTMNNSRSSSVNARNSKK